MSSSVLLWRYSDPGSSLVTTALSRWAALAPQHASLEFLHLDLIRSYISCEKEKELSLQHRRYRCYAARRWRYSSIRPPFGTGGAATEKSVEGRDCVGSYLWVQLCGGQGCEAPTGEGGGFTVAGERGDGRLAGGKGLAGLGEAGCGEGCGWWSMIRVCGRCLFGG